MVVYFIVDAALVFVWTIMFKSGWSWAQVVKVSPDNGKAQESSRHGWVIMSPPSRSGLELDGH